MKPNFALSLSSDGIRLLHRVSDGWRLVGDVSFTSDDLRDKLAVMRRTASMLEPSGVRCKLVIPDDQIRYLSVPFPPNGDAAARTLARSALEGATPYAVDDLAFDTKETGDTLHVAAVARETLAEAEAFAVEHRFHPVCFVADPVESRFAGEPFFGVTQAAADLLAPGQSVEPDTKPLSRHKPAAIATPLTAELTETSPDAGDDAGNDDFFAMEEAEDLTPPAASFVSRRKVPTFRTEAPVMASETVAEAGTAAPRPTGFAESVAQYDAPNRTAIPVPPQSSEQQRLTVFGAREEAIVAGRNESLIKVALVVVVMALGIAAFASGLLSAGYNALFERSAVSDDDLKFAAPLQPELPVTEDAAPNAAPAVELAALDRTLSDEDAAVLDALASLQEDAPEEAPATDPEEELRAFYAIHGIWPKAPDVPQPSALVDLENFYVPGIDPVNPNFDAVALPALASYKPDLSLLAPADPAPADTVFNLDADGFVIPTPQGALNPDGILIYAGEPPIRQPDTLLRIEEPGEDLAQRLILAGFRPALRPDDLIETNERATLSGLTRNELGRLRPRLRPQSAQENARASASLVDLSADASDSALIQEQNENDFDGATARAVAASLRPDVRPNNFSQIVARVRNQAESAPAPRQTAARVAPTTVAPSIPSSASVAREATERNAINLRKVNLIGVYGSPSSRRALVRLGNGRYRKVEVGDRIDGGRVSAIGDSELRYQKSGRAIVLKMPRG